MLLRVRGRGGANPGAILVRGDLAGDPLPVARAVAGEYGLEFGPVDRPVFVVPDFRIPRQPGVRKALADMKGKSLKFEGIHACCGALIHLMNFHASVVLAFFATARL